MALRAGLLDGLFALRGAERDEEAEHDAEQNDGPRGGFNESEHSEGVLRKGKSLQDSHWGR